MEDSEVVIPVGEIELAGTLVVPPGAGGLVVFAYGSGSSRFSPRNRYVASALARKLGTLLVDMLTPDEEAVDRLTAEHRFNIDLLARRLLGVSDWLAVEPYTRELPIGYFGSSTGAAAALLAAAARPDVVAAVVSRGGRPDLAGPALGRVYAPTLLIVGGDDLPVLPLNERALHQLAGVRELAVVPGAGHLFEEPGALAHVAQLARGWFERYLAGALERHAPLH